MLERDWLMVIALGGVFVLLGIVALLWGRHEEKSYYDAIATRPDAREYLNHFPYRPEPSGLKVGGLIGISLGALVMAIGGLFFLLS